MKMKTLVLMLALLLTAHIGTALAGSLTDGGLGGIHIPSHPRPVRIASQQVDLCNSGYALNGRAMGGTILWTLSIENNGELECSEFDLNFPSVKTNEVIETASFEPDLTPVRVDGSGCDLQRADEDATSTWLHCSQVDVPAGGTTKVRIWTAALQSPPNRYCLSGHFGSATSGAVADCVDVYAESDHVGLVLEGPIQIGNGRLEWIGGNYHDTRFCDSLPDGAVSAPNYILPPNVGISPGIPTGACGVIPNFNHPGETAHYADGSYPVGSVIHQTIALPAGVVAVEGWGALGGDSPWSCSIAAEQMSLNCTLDSVPDGLLPALDIQTTSQTSG